MNVLLLAIASYIAGSIPFGLWIGNAKGIDIRTIGSGNIGATNTFRALGPKWGISVFTLDLFKAFVPTIIAIHWIPNPIWHVGIGVIAVLGHSFSPFARFKGGKGVAPALGMIMGLSPIIFIITLIYGISVIAVTRTVSLASISGSILVVTLFIAMGYPKPYIAIVTGLAAIIVIRHRSNIQRLISGTENKLDFKPKKKENK